MTSVTIPGNKQTPAKTFTVGRTYHSSTSYDWFEQDMFFTVIDIKDGRVHWKDIFRRTTGSFITKQFSWVSKYARVFSTEKKQHLIEALFEQYSEFPYG